MAELSTQISEDEAALYDRQIRLWGLDAQKKLRSSRVLLVGVKGLGAEVAKNIILAGIKSLTLLDSENVSAEDLCSQFLVLSSHLGQNRAESSVAQAQQLNPMVDVKADSESLSQKADGFLLNFDVVIMTNSRKEEMIRVDSFCRKNNLKFFAGDVFGFFGYSFEDLHNYTFVEEVKGYFDENDTKQKEQQTKLMKKTLTFSSLQAALEKDWSTEDSSHQMKTLSSSYLILRTLLQFCSTKGRRPALSNSNEDSTNLCSLNDQLLEDIGMSKDRVNTKIFWSVYAELSPVCAIVGGVLAQEVIKAVSCKDTPHNNFFFYNAMEDSGIVELVGNN
uniref:SUMO-activating enzyme subunit 1 n=1 Tax=Strigamia maritima TaxID=126957 RepID=T1JJP0_STRMM